MKQSFLENIKNILKDKIEEDVPNKIFLIILTLPSQYKNNLKDPTADLLSNYEEIKFLQKINNQKIIDYFYFAKNKLNNILYEEDEIITINYDSTKIDVSYLFYLDLLINTQSVICNYEYSFDFIRAIDNNQKEIKEKPYRSIIMAKIIIDLIKYYKELEEFSEEEEEELEKIQMKNEEIIEQNIKIIELNCNKDEIISESLDTIYSKIIKINIFNNDYEALHNIIIQLDLDKIYLTKNMFNEIYYILNSNDNSMSRYKIVNIDEFIKEENVNFYYILCKYILKNSFYIYQIPFLFKIKKKILSILKSYENYFTSNYLNDKLKYILKFFLDSEYYYNRIYLSDLKEVLKYYKEYCFNSKRDDIKEIEKMLEKSKPMNSEKYLSDLEIAQRTNKRSKVIEYLYLSRYKEEENKDEEKLKEIVNLWNNCEKMINENKTKRFKSEFKTILLEYFINEKNQKYLLGIFSKDSIYNFINSQKEKKGKAKKIQSANIPIDNTKNKNLIINSNNEKINFNMPISNENQVKNNEEKNRTPDEVQVIDYEQTNFKTHKDKSQINHIAESKKDYSKKPENEKKKEKQESSKDMIDKNNNEKSLIQNESKNNAISTTTCIENSNLKNPQEENEQIINNNMNEKKININETNNLDKSKEALNVTYFHYFDFAKKILEKVTIIINTNKRGKEPYIIYKNILFGESNINIAYKQLIEKKEVFQKLIKINEYSENYLKFLEFLEEIEEKIKKNFELDYNLKIKIELHKEAHNNVSNPNIYNISCKYTLYNPINNSTKGFREENILINRTDSRFQGFYFLILEANNSDFKDINYENDNMKNNYKAENIRKEETDKDSKNDDKEKEENNQSRIFDETKSKSFITIKEQKTASKEKIIEFIKIIGEHQCAADFIVELSNGYFVSGGAENSIFIYDNYYEKKLHITDLNDWAYKIGERININDKSDNIELLITTNKEMNAISFNKKNFKIELKKYQIAQRTNINFIEMKPNNIIINGIGGSSYFIDVFNKNKLQENKIIDKTYRGAIKISDNIANINSNKVIPKGEDKLLFVNLKKIKKKEFYEIKGNSFVCSVNNQAIIEDNKYKIILCACKKYYDDQKNGILLVNANLGDNKDIEEPFYETNNFEVYCFCPILKVENKNQFIENNVNESYKEKIIITDTKYFLVGGFDTEKREGKIKLYKMIYGEKAWNTKIKELQDIEFIDDNFKDFNGAISCIIQSKITGNILISCYNGYIYSFTAPNIKYYEDIEEKEQKN